MVRRREDEVLEIIKADPLISQKEIADKLGITRSSVGVHVNNLTKKGRIVGRGYVLSKVDKICVIGGSNIDVLGTPSGPLHKGSSNIGSVKISVGGVGRNIAENITKLGLNSELITAISNDEYGKHIQAYCLKQGLRIDKSNVFKNQRTSFYMAIVNEDNKLEYGISDMSIMDQITPAFINQKRSEINSCSMIVLDLNAPKNTIEFILSNFKNKKILIDPVSISKISKIEAVLNRVQVLKLNLLELSDLSSIEVTDIDSVKKAAMTLIDKGVSEIYVTNEFNKMIYISKDDFYQVEFNFDEFQYKEGIREAQFAGLVYGIYNDLDIEDSMKIALVAGQITSENKNRVSPWLSIETVNERLEDE